MVSTAVADGPGHPDGPSGVGQTRRRRGAHPALRWSALALVVVLVAVVLSGHRTELSALATRVGHLSWGWVCAAVAVELCSLTSYALVQAHLLAAGGSRPGLGALLGLTVATNSIANSLPAGPAVSSAFRFRQYRHRGAEAAVAGWATFALLVAAGTSLALFALLGVAVAAVGPDAGSLGSTAWTLVGVAAVTTLGAWLAARPALLVRAARPALLVRAGRLALALVSGLPVRVAGHRGIRWAGQARRVAERARAIRVGRRRGAIALGWALANWTFDCACLACGFAAARVPVPWAGLVLAYAVGQLAALVPVTPGGLGLVEGGLTVTLVAYGGGRTATVLAAVLVYRAVSFWLALPIGWAAWAVLAAKARRAARLAGIAPAGIAPAGIAPAGIAPAGIAPAGIAPAVPVPAASPVQWDGQLPGETVADWVRAPASTRTIEASEAR
jgi:uncharacterized membrane protein YbhN (UPF0104 family)